MPKFYLSWTLFTLVHCRFFLCWWTSSPAWAVVLLAIESHHAERLCLTLWLAGKCRRAGQLRGGGKRAASLGGRSAARPPSYEQFRQQDALALGIS